MVIIAGYWLPLVKRKMFFFVEPPALYIKLGIRQKTYFNLFDYRVKFNLRQHMLHTLQYGIDKNIENIF